MVDGNSCKKPVCDMVVLNNEKNAKAIAFQQSFIERYKNID